MLGVLHLSSSSDVPHSHRSILLPLCLLWPPEGDYCIFWVPLLDGFHLGLVKGRNQQATKAREVADRRRCFLPAPFLLAPRSDGGLVVSLHDYNFYYLSFLLPHWVPVSLLPLLVPSAPGVVIASHSCWSLDASPFLVNFSNPHLCL